MWRNKKGSTKFYNIMDIHYHIEVKAKTKSLDKASQKFSIDLSSLNNSIFQTTAHIVFVNSQHFYNDQLHNSRIVGANTNYCKLLEFICYT
jgi:hypothetical protein